MAKAEGGNAFGFRHWSEFRDVRDEAGSIVQFGVS